ncbi:MAG: hypothetical protein HY314_03215 [Acidobacteria bacterium]|nr:hypothetical protein [Acidobacteriota bacterium]
MNRHRYLFRVSLFIVLVALGSVAALNLIVFGQQRSSSAAKGKELNLRYTYQTRTEMAGMPMQMPAQKMTVYIKGRRQRQDDESRQLATINQCDLQRYVYLNLDDKSCLGQLFKEGEEEPQAGPPVQYQEEREEPTPQAKPRKGGVVVVEGEVTDTGERKERFGLKARHITSKQVMDAKPDSCNPGRFEMTMDVWLVDLPRWTCRVKETPTPVRIPMRPTRPDCQDTIRTNMKGNPALLDGFEIYRKQTVIAQGQTITTIYEVTDLSLAELDAALFEKPADCREKDAQAFWRGVGSPGGFSIAEAMKAAREAAEKESVGEATEPAKAKRAGVLRIGVTIKNDSGAALDVPELRREMVDTIDQRGGDTVDAVELIATAQPDLQAEAEGKQVDYILLVDLREAKPDAGRKLGGILGRAAGVGVKEKTSAKLDYQWIERAKMQTLSTRSLSEKVDAPAPEAMEQFCRKSAEQALSEFWRIRRQ